MAISQLTVIPGDYIGAYLVLTPAYGWGWVGESDALIDYAQIYAAGECRIRIQRFFSQEGQLRGVIGRVEEPGHILQGLWVVGGTRHVGEFDFTDAPCEYNLEFGPEEPIGDGWPTMLPGGRSYAGYGTLKEPGE